MSMFIKTISVNVSCLTLYACVSFYPAVESNTYPGETEDIQAVLIDGGVLEAKAHRHMLVNERADLVFGVGQNSWGVPFRGRLDIRQQDSVWEGEFGKLYVRRSAEDGFYEFPKREYVWVKRESGPGLWLTGTIEHDMIQRDFRGKVNVFAIKEFRVKKFDLGKTLFVTAGAAASSVAFLALVRAMWHPGLSIY